MRGTNDQSAVRQKVVRRIRSVRLGINRVPRDDSFTTNFRFRGFARLLQEWSEREGSPPFAQFIQNCRCRLEAPSFGRLPGRRKRFMQGATLLIREVVTFVIGNEVDHCPIRQSRGLVQHDATVANLCFKRAHVATIRASAKPRNCQTIRQGSFSIESPGRMMPPSRTRHSMPRRPQSSRRRPGRMRSI